MLENANKHNTLPISTILEKLSTINETSNLLPIIIYPFEECYTNWKNIFIGEYPIRSSIRAIVSTGAFITGPLITQIANFTWFKDRCTGLYQSIPIVNLLPEEIGSTICSAYVCGYFLTFVGIQLTDIYNNYKFGGTYHYLTPDKVEKIHQTITSNNFNITPEEIMLIFNKLNEQLKKEPNSRELNDIIVSLRRGDLLSALEYARIFETKINIKENTLNILNELQETSCFPIPRNNIDLANNHSIESLVDDNAILIEDFLEPLANSVNNSNAHINEERINNSNAQIMEESINNSNVHINEEKINNSNTQIMEERINDNNLNNPSSLSETENCNNIQPPIAAILYQYQHKSKNKKKDLDITNTIEILKDEITKLKAKRFVDPLKNFSRNTLT